MKRFIVRWLWVAAIIMTSACSPIQTDELSGTAWYAVQIGEFVPLENFQSTLAFQDGDLSGNAGCNEITGDYTIKNQELSFDPWITLVACPYVMEQEDAFVKAMIATTAYRIEGQHLYLLDAEGRVQVEMAPIQAAPISGTTWRLAQINNGQQAVSSLPEGIEITAQFADGRVSGSAGCNQYFADYTVKDDQLTVSGVGSTKMFCGEPQGVMDQEALFLQALEKAARFKIREQSLTIYNAEGEALLQFEMAAAP